MLATMVLLAGCTAEPAWQSPGPAAAFEGFLMDWFRGDRQGAFQAIWEEDRARLSAPLRELGGLPGAPPTDDAAAVLVVGRVNNPYDFKSIKLAQPLAGEPAPGQVVALELNFHDGQQGRADMVWNGSRWLVKLPLPQDAAATEAPPAPTAAENDLDPSKISPTSP